MSKCVYAYTGATGQGYPPYVNISVLDSGDIRVTVRGDPVHVDASNEWPAHMREGPTVSAIVPAAEIQNLGRIGDLAEES